jgi:ribulose bisphosphate carboxylase small subunit
MGYYISPRFLDKLAIHCTKNYLDIPGVKVPLILGIHGRKGEGKSFQCELAYEKLGISVVHMSAGELEGPDAGDPARLVRLRYREAAELSKVRGKMAALMINDIDAGMGRVDGRTQYTVNTQLVAGTLMNIADNPTNVQLPGSYDPEPIQRIPIIVTGNDFSTLYAPLVRDGRMDKFYWEPDRSDRLHIIAGIFEQDGLSQSDVEQLVDQFANQSIDFYGAIHSAMYDEQVRQFIEKTGLTKISALLARKGTPPEFHKPDCSLNRLVEFGNRLVREQERIKELQLASAYTAFGAAPSSVQSVHRSVDQPQVTDNGSGNGSGGQTHGLNDSNVSVRSQLQSLIEQGARIGIEHVDRRRFRTNSWLCYGMSQGEAAVQLLEDCLREHAQDYVRVVGINPHNRQRISETIIHRPS